MLLRPARRLASSALLAIALVLPGAGVAGADPADPVSPSVGLIAGGTEVTIQATDPPASAQVAAGDEHTLAVTAGGAVYAWGTGDSGQLGLGTVTQSLEPSPIDRAAFGDEEVVQVAAGASHSVALTSSGAVYAWGGNERGQLGLGNGVAGSAEPVLVDSLTAAGVTAVTQVDAGADFVIVLTDTGAVYVWGWGSLGQLGIGSAATQWEPVLVVETLGGAPVSQVAAGNNSVVALTEDGAVYSWGNNGNGRLGAGTTGQNALTPVPVDTSGALAGHTVVHVAVGTGSAYAVTADGSMVAWGNDASGQLGTGTSGASENASPLAVDLGGLPAGARIVEVAAAVGVALARDEQGRVYGWGGSADGVLAGGRDANRPELLVYDGHALGAVTSLSLGPKGDLYGERRAYAVTDSGDVLTWGSGGVGQLGLGAPVDQRVETPASVHTAMTEVLFDDVPAEQVRREGAVVYAVTPPHAAGTVDVEVRTGSRSMFLHPQAFTYGAAPELLHWAAFTLAPAGSRTELNVSVTSSAAVTIQWEIEGADGAWTPVDPDATEQHDDVVGDTATTVLLIIAPDDADRYRVTITNPFGAWVSDPMQVYGVACASIAGEPHAAVAGEPYAFTFATGTGTMVTSLDPGDDLPDGLTLSSDGLLSGTPTTPGTYPFRLLTADPSAHTVCGSAAPTLDVVLVVHEPVTLGGEPPAGEVGVAYAHTFTVGGTPAPTLSIAEGTLPPGLELQADGTLTGVPTAAGDYQVGVVAANGVGASARVDVVIRIDPAAAAGAGPDAGAGAGTGAGLAWTGADGLLQGVLLAAALLGVGGLLALRRWRGTR